VSFLVTSVSLTSVSLPSAMVDVVAGCAQVTSAIL